MNMDTKKETYYDVLEVSPTASEEIIRSAYKALARKYHPDVSSDSREKANRRMVEINEAYEVLSNPEKRASYDVLLMSRCTDYGKNVPDGTPERNTQRTNRYRVNDTAGGNMAKAKNSNKGCLSRILTFFVVIITIIVFLVRGCSRDVTEFVHESVPANVSNSPQSRAAVIDENVDREKEPEETPAVAPDHPKDKEWDNAANSYLESAINEADYEEKLGKFMTATYLQYIEYAFKKGIYEEIGGKNFDKLPSAKKQAAEISHTVDLMTETFGDEVAAEIVYLIITDCTDWIYERKSDVAASLGKVLNLENADIDDLWELYLSANGGAKAFFPD